MKLMVTIFKNKKNINNIFYNARSLKQNKKCLFFQLTSAENEVAELNKALEDQEQQFEDELSRVKEEAELQRVRGVLMEDL